MLRKILGVILGYIVMAVFIFMTFSGFYLAIGADGAYNPGTYDVSILWISVSSVLGLVAAIIGGYICAKIAGDRRTAIILAGIVLGLGIALGIMQAMAPVPPEEVRTGDVSNFDAMQKSRQPVWLAFLNPLIGAVGIYIGGGLGGKKG